MAIPPADSRSKILDLFIPWRGGAARRRRVTKRGMRPRRIVVSDPSLDDLLRLIEIKEQAFIQQFVTHATVEGFDVTVLHRLAGRDVVPFQLMLLAPAIQRSVSLQAGPNSNPSWRKNSVAGHLFRHVRSRVLLCETKPILLRYNIITL
jgi:hypothetical protein